MTTKAQSFAMRQMAISSLGASPDRDCFIHVPLVRRSTVHSLALALVWVTLATSGLVVAEPAPVDLLLMGLVVLLPLIGLATITPGIAGYLGLWLAIAGAGFFASIFAADAGRAALHTGVSLYLSLASAVLAGFVIRSPETHTRLILDGYLTAALVATTAAIAGYFDIVAGTAELFTKFGRAAGTFKDPNVFGAFLVAPVIYCLHLIITRPLHRAALPILAATILTLGVLVSFSRGAWINLALAVCVYGCLAILTAGTRAARCRIAGLAGSVILIGATVAFMAMQVDKVADLIEARATLSQSYDVGPEGRFGGQQKALRLVAENPLGIGAQDFAQSYHHEEVHNVYLGMALNAGWLGGGLFLILNALTLVVGFTAITSNSHASRRPLLIVAYAAFAATAFEGIIIDSDHWRHLYIEMALVWGLAHAAGGGETSSGAYRAHAVGREILHP